MLCESYSWGENKIHHRIEMKQTPTHPVPDLHRALKTLPLRSKCGNEWRDVVCVQRESELRVCFNGWSVLHEVTHLQSTFRLKTLKLYYVLSTSWICIFKCVFIPSFYSNCAIFDCWVVCNWHSFHVDLIPSQLPLVSYFTKLYRCVICFKNIKYSFCIQLYSKLDCVFTSSHWFTECCVWPTADKPHSLWSVAAGYINRQWQRRAAGDDWINSIGKSNRKSLRVPLI